MAKEHGHETFCFNPCFNGSDSKSLLPAEDRTESSCVSILVLMEVTLKAALKAAIVSLTSCFNPCFNGSDSKSPIFLPLMSR